MGTQHLLRPGTRQRRSKVVSFVIDCIALAIGLAGVTAVVMAAGSLVG